MNMKIDATLLRRSTMCLFLESERSLPAGTQSTSQSSHNN